MTPRSDQPLGVEGVEVQRDDLVQFPGRCSRKALERRRQGVWTSPLRTRAVPLVSGPGGRATRDREHERQQVQEEAALDCAARGRLEPSESSHRPAE